MKSKLKKGKILTTIGTMLISLKSRLLATMGNSLITSALYGPPEPVYNKKIIAAILLIPVIFIIGMIRFWKSRATKKMKIVVTIILLMIIIILVSFLIKLIVIR